MGLSNWTDGLCLHWLWWCCLWLCCLSLFPRQGAPGSDIEESLNVSVLEWGLNRTICLYGNSSINHYSLLSLLFECLEKVMGENYKCSIFQRCFPKPVGVGSCGSFPSHSTDNGKLKWNMHGFLNAAFTWISPCRGFFSLCFYAAERESSKWSQCVNESVYYFDMFKIIYLLFVFVF